jgi:hypothetical protein
LNLVREKIQKYSVVVAGYSEIFPIVKERQIRRVHFNVYILINTSSGTSITNSVRGNVRISGPTRRPTMMVRVLDEVRRVDSIIRRAVMSASPP